MLRHTKNLTVIYINGTLRIYSNENNIYIPTEVINSSKLVQDFGIIYDNDDDDDEYIITKSDDDITIHTWKNNLKTSTIKNSELRKKLCKEDDSFNGLSFTHIEFKDNEVHLYLYDGKKWVTKKTKKNYWKKLLNLERDNGDKNKNSSNSKGVNGEKSEKSSNSKGVNDNIFYNIGKFKNEEEFIKNYIKLEQEKNQNNNDLIEGEQNKYDLLIEKKTKKNKNKDEYYILISKSNNKEITSYDTKLKSNDWEYEKVCGNITLFYNERELRIFTFDMKFKIQCFNIKFSKHAIDLKWDEDFNEIVKPTEINYINKQWILYSLNQKGFLARYGSKLLKSAIEENNEGLIKEIIDKTLKYYEENQDLNIYLLSIISENMNHLSQKYSDFLLDYYDNIEEIEKIKILKKKISSSEYIYNNSDHIHSFYIELKTYNSILNLNFRVFSDIFNCCIKYFRNYYGDCSKCYSKCCKSCYSKCCKCCCDYSYCCCCLCCSTVFGGSTMCAVGFLIALCLKNENNMNRLIAIVLTIFKILLTLIMIIMMVTFYILSYMKQDNSFLAIAIVFTFIPIFLILIYFKKSRVPLLSLYSFIIMTTFYILSYTMKQNNSFLAIAIVFTIFTIFLTLSLSRSISKLTSKLFSILKPDRKPKIKLIVPFPNYMAYPKEYNSFSEFLNPKSSPFSKTQINNEFYKTWNGEAIINFKWRLFGKYYYAAIWFLFTTFLVCFTLASSVSSKAINSKEKDLLISSIILGFIHLSFEIRQFIWNPKQWILNVWNLIGMYYYNDVTYYLRY
jgi:hypothetical protein